MNAPKRWVDTESGSNDFERALLQPAVQVDIPAGAEQEVWLGLAGLVASASLPVATAAAKAGAAEAATLASSGSGSAVGAGTAKLAVAALVKAFAVGATAGTLLAGGYTLASRHDEPGSQRAASQTSAATKVETLSEGRAPAVARSPLPSVMIAPSASSPIGSRLGEARALEPSSPPSALPPVATFDVQPAAPENAKSAEHASRLREEARVLRNAREALRRGDLASAFAALEVARTEFAAGMLGEEREALTVELLAKSGQREAARQRARAFLHAFPRSAHAERVRSFTE